jgi:serine/threonine protein kinase
MQGTEEIYQVHSAIAIRWAAPEVLGEQAATTASDVYSLAVTMWECFSRGEKPFSDQQTHSGVTIAVIHGQRPPRPAAVTNDRLWDLIQTAWTGEPAMRPSAGKVAQQLEAILATTTGTKAPSGTMPADISEDHYSGVFDGLTVPLHYSGIQEESSDVPDHYSGIPDDG